MLVQDNQTSGDRKDLYDDVIDCVEIALWQEPETFEIKNTKIGLADFYDIISDCAMKSKNRCCGPFKAAELIAEKLDAKFVRANYRYGSEQQEKGKKVIKLEDLL